MKSDLLRPYLSGLLTGDELNGALSQFRQTSPVTILADSPRRGSLRGGAGTSGDRNQDESPKAALFAGLARILHEGGVP